MVPYEIYCILTMYVYMRIAYRIIKRDDNNEVSKLEEKRKKGRKKTCNV